MDSEQSANSAAIRVQFRILKFEVWILRVFAAATVVCGFIISIREHNPHSFERVGPILVVASLLATFWQFIFEGRAAIGSRSSLRRTSRMAAARELSLEDAEKVVSLRSEEVKRLVENARRTLLLNSLIVAAIGEVVHGFGDLAIEAFLSLQR